MKKIILSLTILIVFTITANIANAQTYQPFPTESASWEVVRCWYFYQPGWFDKYTFTLDGSDTLYNGSLFKKIYVTNHHLPGTVYDSIYPTEFFGGLRESNKQIFIYQVWASTDTTIQLIYDFNNTNVGDTIYTNVLSGYPNLLGHIITSKDSVLIGTKYHKRLHLQDPSNNYNTENWIEGVGSSWGLPFASFWSATDNSYDLSCYYKNQQLLYENPSPTYSFCQAPHPIITCEPVSTFVSESASKNISFNLYPNPASDVVTLNGNFSYNKNLRLNIYNIVGALVRSEILEQNQLQINIGDLNDGIYTVVLKSNYLIESSRLIIQR